MQDALSFLLILIVLYLSDCFIFVHRNSILLRAFTSYRWSVFRPGNFLGNQSGGLFMVNPLPPLGRYFLSQPIPVSFSEEGAVSFIPQVLTKVGRPKQIERWIRWDEVESVEAIQRDLMVNGTLFVKCRTQMTAERLAEQFRMLAKQPKEKREGLIDQAIELQFDLTELKEQVEFFKKQTRVQGMTCSLFFTYIYLICPLVVWKFGFGLLLIPMALVGLSIHLPLIWLFNRQFKLFYPTENARRWEEVVKLALCPPMAIRAVDNLSKEFLEQWHPIAVVFHLCESEEFNPFFEMWLRDLEHPVPWELESDEASATVESFRKRTIEAVYLFFENHQIGVSSFKTEPERLGEDEKTYCPRCLNTFTLSEGQCMDCFGVELIKGVERK